jgi:2-aminoadipate transaminase
MRAEDWLSARIRESEASDAAMRRGATSDLIVFGGGLPDPVTHPTAEMGAMIGEIAAANEPLVMGYGPSPGDPALRELIAARMAADGARLGPENVVLTNGSSGAIGLVAVALLEPGDVVVVESYSYGGAIKAFRQMGAEIVAAPMDREGLDPEGLAGVLDQVRAQGRRIKLIYTIATCHNPTASVLPLARRQAVLALAEMHDALVVQDDTYGDIRFAEDFPPSFMALAPERTVHLGSFSKTVAPGIRVGWAAAGAEISAAFARARVDLGASPLTQRFVARYMAEGLFEPHLAEANALYRRKRDRMAQALARHAGGLARWETPQGGFFLWLELARAEADAVAAAGLDEKVAFLSGSYFSVGAPDAGRRLRLSYGQLPEDQIEEGVARFGRALAQASEAVRSER